MHSSTITRRLSLLLTAAGALCYSATAADTYNSSGNGGVVPGQNELRSGVNDPHSPTSQRVGSVSETRIIGYDSPALHFPSYGSYTFRDSDPGTNVLPDIDYHTVKGGQSDRTMSENMNSDNSYRSRTDMRSESSSARMSAGDTDISKSSSRSDSDRSDMDRSSSSKSSDRSDAKAAKGTSFEKGFAKKAAMGNSMEVAMGKIGQEKATNSQVKEFAERLVKDHGDANDNLLAIDAVKSWKVTSQSDMATQKAQKMTSGMEGADFDKQFVADMVKDHTKAAADYQKAIDTATTPELKAYAEKTLPTIKEHLKIAKELQGQVGTASKPDKM